MPCYAPSGRLKKIFIELAERNNWNWEMQLSLNPDAELIKSELIVVTSDSVILDSCQKWVNLAAEIINEKVENPWIVDLS